MPEDEFRLIQLAQCGDAEACAALYSRHYDAVYRYCYYRLGDSSLAEDLAGEVFVRMVEKLDTFQLRGRPLLPGCTPSLAIWSLTCTEIKVRRSMSRSRKQ